MKIEQLKKIVKQMVWEVLQEAFAGMPSPQAAQPPRPLFNEGLFPPETFAPRRAPAPPQRQPISAQTVVRPRLTDSAAGAPRSPAPLPSIPIGEKIDPMMATGQSPYSMTTDAVTQIMAQGDAADRMALQIDPANFLEQLRTRERAGN